MSRVSEISPILSRVFRNVGPNANPQLQLRELASQFRADAMLLDPSIKHIDIVHDMTLPGVEQAVCAIVISRDESSLVGRPKQ
ncbi:hypothetical protein [Devosia sp.]|uniref:hypothetical protein n=1 Tax=Devosia sp. TaxID=1871048 RepID=UPI001AC0F360|nr:hypothetical protein [Devosia sp.]MBN9333273.1 hypothetical protein [Devosia sp.]